MLMTFILCHLLGMSSAAINPILYGYMNETFKAEFYEIFDLLLCRKSKDNNNGQGGQDSGSVGAVRCRGTRQQ
jgi:hypothetical protein